MNRRDRHNSQADAACNPLRLYGLLQCALLTFAWPWLPLLALSAKRRATVWQRLWLGPRPVALRNCAGTRPIWLHALSVGEVASALPLVRALRRALPDLPLVVTASTATGLATARRLMAPHAQAILAFPHDLVPSVSRAIRAIDPSLVLFVESDLWPGMLLGLQRRQVPALWINARISDRSLRRYAHCAAWTRPVLSALRAVGAQSAQDAQRLARIGIDPSRIRVTGNLKFDQPPTPPPGPIVAQLHERLAQAGAASHVIVAGSTHDGEETLLLQALIRCRRSHPHAVLVLAPRHPQRAAAIARTAKALGCAAVDLTELERSGGSRLPPVVIIDRLGLLQELYTLAQVAVVGGSLLPIHGIGGHNPLEPAACAKPILFGPHMDNFRPVARLLCASGAAFEVRGLEQLGDRLERLLAEPAAARHAGQAAAAVMTAHRGAVAASVELVLRVRTQRAESTTDPAGCGRGAVDSPARLCY